MPSAGADMRAWSSPPSRSSPAKKKTWGDHARASVAAQAARLRVARSTDLVRAQLRETKWHTDAREKDLAHLGGLDGKDGREVGL